MHELILRVLKHGEVQKDGKNSHETDFENGEGFEKESNGVQGTGVDGGSDGAFDWDAWDAQVPSQAMPPTTVNAYAAMTFRVDLGRRAANDRDGAMRTEQAESGTEADACAPERQGPAQRQVDINRPVADKIEFFNSTAMAMERAKGLKPKRIQTTTHATATFLLWGGAAPMDTQIDIQT